MAADPNAFKSAALTLGEDLRIELLALTKVVLNWKELSLEYKQRGFGLRLIGDGLFLAQGLAEGAVICNLGALGYGTSLRDLTRRFGPFVV